MTTQPRGESASAPQKVLLGMGGGTASAVAAALLKSQRYEVHAVFLDCAHPLPEGWSGFRSHCMSADPWPSIQRTCQKLEIPCERVPVQEAFIASVIDPVVHDLAGGRVAFP